MLKSVVGGLFLECPHAVDPIVILCFFCCLFFFLGQQWLLLCLFITFLFLTHKFLHLFIVVHGLVVAA